MIIGRRRRLCLDISSASGTAMTSFQDDGEGQDFHNAHRSLRMCPRHPERGWSGKAAAWNQQIDVSNEAGEIVLTAPVGGTESQV